MDSSGADRGSNCRDVEEEWPLRGLAGLRVRNHRNDCASGASSASHLDRRNDIATLEEQSTQSAS